MEIIKQLYDVASLFDRVDNLAVVRETFGKLSVLLNKGIDTINRYDPSVDLRGERLELPVNPVINKVKSLRPEAFWYWKETERLLRD